MPQQQPSLLGQGAVESGMPCDGRTGAKRHEPRFFAQEAGVKLVRSLLGAHSRRVVVRARPNDPAAFEICLGLVTAA